MSLQNKLKQYMEGKLEAQKTAGATFMTSNKDKEGVKELPGGIQYEVIKVWELPPDQFLSAGLGLLPLACVSAVGRQDVPKVKLVQVIGSQRIVGSRNSKTLGVQRQASVKGKLG